MWAVAVNKPLRKISERLACGAALAFWLLGLWVTPAVAARITNEPNGFGGYLWGSPSAQYPSLRHVQDAKVANQLDNVEVFENPGDALTLNGATLTQIYYRFWKGKLGSVELKYEGRANREKLREWIENNYGKLPLSERKQQHIEWHGDNTVISLGYDPLTNLGRLWVIYLALSPFDNSLNTTGAVQ
jgi:hypothetical protein